MLVAFGRGSHDASDQGKPQSSAKINRMLGRRPDGATAMAELELAHEAASTKLATMADTEACQAITSTQFVPSWF